MAKMIQEIRRDNLIKLAKEFRYSKDFCKKIGIKPAYWAQVKVGNKKNIGSLVARRAEENLGLQAGYLDVQHDKNTDDFDENHNQRNSSTLNSVINLLPTSVAEQMERLIYSIAAELQSKRSNND